MANRLMTRAFSAREKVLLLVLSVLLIGACYYLLVVKNVADMKDNNAAQLEEVQMQIDAQQSLLLARSQMVKALEELGPTEQLPAVAVYDNVRNEINELNAALAGASTSNLSFGQPELDGTLVRRAVSVSYTVPTTEAAIAVMKELQNGTYACEILDFSLTNSLKTDGGVSSVAATLTLTYFETTTGSTNLSGLVEKAPASASASTTVPTATTTPKATQK
ncbi:MAG: type II secretion system protein GspM [Raoultibacter sp.]